MATVAQSRLLTAEEFMDADLGEGKHELVRGEVVEIPPAMPEHGLICRNMIFVLESYGRQSGFGYTLANDAAVVTERNPDTVRGADVCFYSHARWPRAKLGYELLPVPPDLAVAVVSPGNRVGPIMKKVSEYLEVGVSVVWVVYPKRRQLVVYRASAEEPMTLGEDAVVENLPDLPGFRCAVRDFFV